MADEKVTKLPDRLKHEGVMCQGYGLIYKFPMQDPDLCMAAKGIYALICSMANSNTGTAFPSREQIISLLHISKDSYYKGMEQLKQYGYLTVKRLKPQSNGRFETNEYTIAENPRKFKESDTPSSGGKLTGVLKVDGIKSAGYGMLPRAVMFDSRLTLTAKVMYAYLASYTGAGTVAFPDKYYIKLHLGIKETAYKSHMQKLTQANYVTLVQRHVNGHLSVNDCNLNTYPDKKDIIPPAELKKLKHVVVKKKKGASAAEDEDAVQMVAKKDMAQMVAKKDMVQMAVEKDMDQEDMVIQDMAEQDTGFQDVAIKDTNINKSSINNIPTINPSINKPHWTDGMTRGEIFNYIVAKLNPYDTCLAMNIPLSDDEIDFIIGVIADFIASDHPFLRITGVKYDRVDVITKLLALDCSDYAYVHKKVTRIQTPIINPKSYYLACLYSAKEDHAVALAREIEQDQATGF